MRTSPFTLMKGDYGTGLTHSRIIRWLRVQDHAWRVEYWTTHGGRETAHCRGSPQTHEGTAPGTAAGREGQRLRDAEGIAQVP